MDLKQLSYFAAVAEEGAIPLLRLRGGALICAKAQLQKRLGLAACWGYVALLDFLFNAENHAKNSRQETGAF